MKKIFVLFAMLSLLLLLFCSCECKHDKCTEATCDTPAICLKCEEKVGSALGHEWQVATCINPKTCRVCKTSDGNALGHVWNDATCTIPKQCMVCKKTEGYSLGHYFAGTTDGTCIDCGFGVKFILPTIPTTITDIDFGGGTEKMCKIESIKIERVQEYYFSTPEYRLTFIVESTYHKKGNSYNDKAGFGWKLYDEDGEVVKSGTSRTIGEIKVGEKSKVTIKFSVDTDGLLQDGKTYRLELLDTAAV